MLALLRGLAAVMVFTLALSGCGAVAPVGDLDALTDDANGNGFFDVTPPDGVEFLTLDNLKVRLANVIAQDELGGLAAEFGVDPALLNLVTLKADIVVMMDYGAGITDELVQSEAIDPFDKRFEIACPERVTVEVDVIAEVPVVGPQSVTDFSVSLAAGDHYTCGQTIAVEVFINASGDPDVAVDVQ